MFKKDITKQIRQSIENLKGEITFREKLAKQHVNEEVLLPDYYRKSEIDAILSDRILETVKRIHFLICKKVCLSPFLELGAERGQRALVLTNDFNAEGFALDVSYHQLKTMQYYAKLFNRPRLPLRICGNAYTLPFTNKSFPFVFCYEFLHHFPSPAPIVREIYRILGRGHFFFDEEPFKRLLKFRLYKRKDKIYSQIEMQKNRFIKLFQSLFSEPFTDEEEHGVIENSDISLKEWNTVFSIFDDRDINLISLAFLDFKLHRNPALVNFINSLLGGKISGLCRKDVKSGSVVANSDIWELLACPNCVVNVGGNIWDRPQLLRHDVFLACPLCKFEFPIVDGIIFLLPKNEFEQLYPAFLRK